MSSKLQQQELRGWNNRRKDIRISSRIYPYYLVYTDLFDKAMEVYQEAAMENLIESFDLVYTYQLTKPF